MNILLINPIHKKAYNDVLRFPLGLAYISDALTESRHNTEILDLAPIEWDIEYLKKKIPQYCDIDAIGLTGLITEYQNIKEISGLFKKYYSEKPIILGGAFATSMPNQILNTAGVDIIVSGEGEVTVKELFNILQTDGDLSTVRGIYFKKNGQLFYTGSREYVSDLDTIGYPSRKGFDIEVYFSNSPFAMFGNRRTLNMIASRGCPYSCFYCDKGLWGNTYRMRSPENIVSEIKYLIDAFSIDSIIFHDDTFYINKDRISKLCDLLIANDIHINWLANCRADLISLEITKKMRKAGCRIIAYGVESGNQDILNSMKKNIRLEKVSEGIRNAWKARIIPFGYLMIGWFNETKEQVLDTINFCRSNRLKGDFSFFTPLPNTPAFIQAKSMGNYMLDDDKILANWGRWHEQTIINVSSMNNDELVFLKKYAEKKIFWSYFIDNVFLYIKALGMFCFVKELTRRIIYFSLNGFKVRLEKV